MLAPALSISSPWGCRPVSVHHECAVQTWGLDLLPDRRSIDPDTGVVGHVLVPARMAGRECAICAQRLDRCPWLRCRVHEMQWSLTPEAVERTARLC